MSATTVTNAGRHGGGPYEGLVEVLALHGPQRIALEGIPSPRRAPGPRPPSGPSSPSEVEALRERNATLARWLAVAALLAIAAIALAAVGFLT